jgi:hypothetical protein
MDALGVATVALDEHRGDLALLEPIELGDVQRPEGGLLGALHPGRDAPHHGQAEQAVLMAISSAASRRVMQPPVAQHGIDGLGHGHASVARLALMALKSSARLLKSSRL